jgi:hypothetical protein
MNELKSNMMVTDGYDGNDFHSEYVLNVSHARVPRQELVFSWLSKNAFMM